MKPTSQSVNQATNQPMRKTMSSPTSNHQKTALVEGLPMGLPEFKSGTDLAPNNNLVAVVNKNLRDCEWHKGTPLVLEPDRRVGFAVNWKLTCRSCDEKDGQMIEHLKYLKKSLLNHKNAVEKRRLQKTISRQGKN